MDLNGWQLFKMLFVCMWCVRCERDVIGIEDAIIFAKKQENLFHIRSHRGGAETTQKQQSY